jgi:hypothetical protein
LIQDVMRRPFEGIGKTVKHLGGGFPFAAATTPFDFATQTVDYRLATLLIFFQQSQHIPYDLASGSVTTDTTCAIEDLLTARLAYIKLIGPCSSPT